MNQCKESADVAGATILYAFEVHSQAFAENIVSLDRAPLSLFVLKFKFRFLSKKRKVGSLCYCASYKAHHAAPFADSNMATVK